MINILSLSASPVEGSSTDILLDEITAGIIDSLSGDAMPDVKRVRLNETKGIPCQSCGKAPTDSFCFYEDDISSIYSALAECDCLLFGTPIYFDSVSAQAKLFIDRCNCFRPADFDNRLPNHDFIKRLTHKRPGAMVLVGGKDAWFEGARRCLAGFFKWVEVSNEGMITFSSDDYTKKGIVSDSPDLINEARQLGEMLAHKVRETHDR